LAVEPIKSIPVDIILVESNIQGRLNFGYGALRHMQELAELFIAASRKALGDIEHHRHRRSANLVFQPKVLVEMPV
jgi:hypothetical protein